MPTPTKYRKKPVEIEAGWALNEWRKLDRSVLHEKETSDAA